MGCPTTVLFIFIFIHLCMANLHICSIGDCICEDTKISCRDKDPQSYYIEKNRKYIHLDFRYCAIQFISPGYFDKFLNLKKVDIRHQSLDFDCRSLPKKRSFVLISDCEKVKRTFPPTSSQSTIHTTSIQRDLMTSTYFSFRHSIRTKQYITETTRKLGSTFTSRISPNFFTTEADNLFTFSDSQTNTLSSPANTAENTDYPPTTSFNNKTMEYTTSSIITGGIARQVSGNKPTWLIIAIIMTLITFVLLSSVAVIFLIRRRRLHMQMSRLRFSNEIYLGDLNFDNFHGQMLHPRGPITLEGDDSTSIPDNTTTQEESRDENTDSEV